MKKLFYDLETTGLDKDINGIHQISGCIEMNDKVMEYFNFKVQPKEGAVYDAKALEVGNVTEEQLKSYESMDSVYNKLIKLMSKYVNRFNRTDKFFLVGYNNASFDNPFLRQWFEDNKDVYFGSWFWSHPLDVMVLATEYLLEERATMENFKLKTVAARLGLVIAEEKLHDAVYDIELTRSIYRIVTNKISAKKQEFAVLDDLPF